MKKPATLRRGKEFHKKVQQDWEATAENGEVHPEHVIGLVPTGARRRKSGRLDIFVDELGDLVSVVEIKATDWDSVAPRNRKKLLASHRRQVWRYIERYLDVEHVDVCPGIIYPRAPWTPGLRETVEDYHNDWGLQVVWYED